ncbi:hypothetical protein ISS21_00340 [Patescibacteria group bacterium]|nr:hypothetical protein [Patescibacteria group bacterium]
MIFQRKKIYFVLILSLIIIGYSLSANFSQAAAVENVTLKDPLGERDVPELAGSIIQYILGIVGVLALVMFIYGGIIWMTSGGSPEKIKTGKDTIVWAILGLAFIFFSYAILDFVLRAFIE